jgi:hypothetical protein
MVCDIGYAAVVTVIVSAVFCGAGAGIAYGVAKAKFEERVTSNRAAIVQVFGTPCYIDKGVVIGNQLQREPAIFVDRVSEGGEVTVETLPVTFIDDDLVFWDAAPIGLCGSSRPFWVLKGDASVDLEKAVTYKLTPPEHYCLMGAVYGFTSLLVLCMIWLACACMCLECRCCREDIRKSACYLYCCNRSQLRAERAHAERMRQVIMGSV